MKNKSKKHGFRDDVLAKRIIKAMGFEVGKIMKCKDHHFYPDGEYEIISTDNSTIMAMQRTPIRMITGEITIDFSSLDNEKEAVT